MTIADCSKMIYVLLLYALLVPFNKQLLFKLVVARSTDLLPLTVFKIAAYATEYIIPYIFYFVNYSYC